MTARLTRANGRVAVLIAAAWALAACAATAPRATGESVLFYEVPLECGAAPDLGCGSLAKPVLLDLEEHAAVREAWLNRPGTVIAVVGEPSAGGSKKLAAVVRPILASHGVRAMRVEERERAAFHLADFRSPGQWYRGAAVDSLSVEEAGQIAEDAVALVKDARLIDATEAAAIQSEIESYFRTELVRLRTPAELEASNPDWFEEVSDIYVRHVGEERAEAVRRLYEERLSEEPVDD